MVVYNLKPKRDHVAVRELYATNLVILLGRKVCLKPNEERKEMNKKVR